MDRPPKKDVFNPMVDDEGNRLEKPLYLPKYIKTVFTLSPENATEIAKLVERGEYHTVGNYVNKDGVTSSPHGFLVVEMVPTGNPDEYVLLSEDYGPIQ